MTEFGSYLVNFYKQQQKQYNFLMPTNNNNKTNKCKTERKIHILQIEQMLLDRVFSNS